MHWYKESEQRVGSLEVLRESRLEEYFSSLISAERALLS